ncbi:MAG: ABC transporter permease [Armatimonadetes bacterium]|nr:ABC transporter permease [Armatimonadota bacterium]
MEPLESLLKVGIAMATPLLFAALGEILAERAGVINVGLEGMMLAGAFLGMAGSYYAHSPWVGLLLAACGGTAGGALLGFFAVRLGADQVVSGTAINILALGITGVFYRGLFGATGSAVTVATFSPLPVPVLKSLPWVGPGLFEQNILVYLGLVAVPALHLFLFRTRPGLRWRACGEFPEAADSAGIAVNRVRWLGCLLCGALAGVGGAFLSLGHSNTFVENMSAGRGFIALAVVIFGLWRPWGALGAALLFGLASGLQFQFQARGLAVPYQFFLALPYLLTLAALALRSGKAAPPAALAQPYRRQ